MGLINYLGNSKVIKRICQLLNVTDVQDGEGHSLVDENGIAIVSGGGGGSSTLAGLTDVDVTGASGGDVLALNGTSGKWEDKALATVATSGDFNDLSNQPTIPAAQVNSDWNSSSGVSQILNKPTKLSDFSNDSGFITNTVNNLTNYYKKTETYTQAEVDALISAVVTIDIEVVQTLPTTDISTTTIYLLPKQTAGTDDVYDEYINTTGTSAGWELIGSTQVDLSNYYTKSEVDALIPDDLADLNDDSTHRLVTDTEKTAWNGKSVVSANPQTTTGTLSGLTIDGVGYEIPSGSGVQSDWNESDITSEAYIKNKPSIPAAQVNADWNASSGVAQILNKPTIPDISTKVSKSGDTMSGPLLINPTNAVGNYDEGVRINKASNGYSSLMFGGTSGTTAGTEDGEWWVGCNLSSLGRKLYIAHNGSTDCDTYFEVDSASDRHPKLHITNTGGVASGNYRAVNGNDVFNYLKITSTTGTFSNFKCSQNYPISFQKTGHIVRISTVIFNPDWDIGANEGLAPVPDGYRPTDSYVYFVSTNNIVFTIEGNVLKTANISATIPKGWYYPLNMFFMV